ncbi:MAG TPA: acyltransferase [Flavisolibacter sp.]|nr:acyltransferase [Flavisolibacter sp.]
MLPWPLRRRILNRYLGYQIHPKAKIGIAWIFPKKLQMAEGAFIDHFTVAIHLDEIIMEAGAYVGRSNWITGFPTGTSSPHFQHQQDRKAVLLLKRFSSVTKKHHLDCTNAIEIGAFSTIAGYDSQFLTHSINIVDSRQDSAPIKIGDYTFVGTNVVVLGGAVLPDYCVLGAKSLLNKSYTEKWILYGGVPAKALTTIPANAKYFTREKGFVD